MKSSCIFLPLSVSFQVKEDRHPEILLIGKKETGEVVECIIHSFLPYFYMDYHADIPESDLKQCHDLILEVEQEEYVSIYEYQTEKRNLLKIKYMDPRKVQGVKEALIGTYKKYIPNKKVNVYETRIEYLLRFMRDKEIVGMGYVEVENYTMNDGVVYAHEKDIFSRNEIKRLPPLRILSFDLECIGEEDKFPSATKDPVVQIGCAISEYPISTPKKKVLFALKDVSSISGVEIHSYNTEKEMLLGWSVWVKKQDPDIITGYNTARFDFPYLLDRAKALKLDKFPYFARTNKRVTVRGAGFGIKESVEVNIPGRVLFDAFEVVRKEFKLDSYSLNNVANAFLGEMKEDVHYSEIPKLFKGSKETRKRLGTYCMKDALLPLQIIFKKNLLINYCELARVTGVPLEYLVNRGQGVRVLSQIVRAAKKSGYILPDVPEDMTEYEGAFVMEPEKGFYTDPVAVLDFASLYPSIIMAYNLCYTTLIPLGEEKMMKKEEYVESPSGDYFVAPHVRKGLLPSILSNLLESRKEARKQLKNETDEEMKMSLDARQLALKISANSVYGFTGAQKTGLPCIPISRSVTAFGREILKKTKRLIEEKYSEDTPNKMRVVYGDTDSVMVTSDGSSLAEAFEAGKSISEYITKKLPNPLTLEFEKVYYPFLLLNKKKYAGNNRASPEDKGKIDMKGIETVRRDNCLLVRNLMKECLNKIFMDNDVEAAKNSVKKCISLLMNEKISISQLIITKSISKKSEDYSAHLAHVELANRLKLRDPGSAPGIGDRVSYVVIKGNGPLYTRSESPTYALEKKIPIDTTYYLEHQIKNPITRILEYVVDGLQDLFKVQEQKSIRTDSFVGPKAGLKGFAVKKVCCLICNVGKHPICVMCLPILPDTIEKTRNKLVFLQKKFHMLMGECQRMQRSLLTPITCSNVDCALYYIRVETTRKINELQQKYNQLVAQDTK
ncbi:DNA polymerase delta subunit 1 [Nematocida sp. LUAm3]|nr:DNA polymerase delta subunit 1 [Nematocida sp. LUAm3]KAI5173634.1 DNA polymerase delta subunit 1 [Nematocida sp. LUAm2]KAI5176855.1 DNA polymerase delta subunit 1 [Nematocida sp. LUAm1]